MTQKTAKTVEDVLEWVETNAHHRGWKDDGVLVLAGHSAVLRIPRAVHEKTMGLIEPGGQFDARMYRATKSGKARLRRARRAALVGLGSPAA